MKKVIAVVVTFNRKVLLKEAIEALLNNKYPGLEVLVTDNASTDGTKEYISELLDNPRVHYVNTGDNLGGAGGFNFGMKEAYKLGCDYMWLMDDDCIVHEDSLEKLMAADEKLKGNYGFLSSKVLWTDGNLCRMNLVKETYTKNVEDWETPLVKIVMATFVSFFVKTEVVREVGLPIKEFFIWSDDLEYSRRISMKYPGYLVNDSVVTHKCKSNIGSDISRDMSESLWRYPYAYRNEIYVCKREGFYGRFRQFERVVMHCLRVIFRKNDRKGERLKIILSNTFKGMKFNPPIEYLE